MRELQIVTITPPGPAQAVPCRVVMIEGAQALLLSRDAISAALMRDCMLTFDYEGRPVALMGHVRRCADEHEVQFVVSDGVQIPRRGASRLEVSLVAEVARHDTPDDRWEATTVDVSSKGLLLEPANDLRIGESVDLALSLPKADTALSLSARVVRVAGGRAGAETTEISQDDLARLNGLIREGKLALALQRAPAPALREG
jgi:hypothetical protein